MQHVVRTLAAIRFALSTRRDLLLEMLALRHQLAVVTRSNRRFRPSDRLAWLILRRVWPRWRDALVLVQPATVDRWHRVSTPVENLTVPPIENLTDRRGDEPQFVEAS